MFHVESVLSAHGHIIRKLIKELEREKDVTAGILTPTSSMGLKHLIMML